MKKVFIGYFLIMLNIPADYLQWPFSLLFFLVPIGALLIHSGIRELKSLSQNLEDVSELSLLLALSTLLLITLLFIDKPTFLNMFSKLIFYATMAAQYFVLFKVIAGVRDFEVQLEQPLYGDTLFISFFYVVALQLVVLLLRFEPITFVSTFGFLVAKVYFLFNFYLATSHYIHATNKK